MFKNKGRDFTNLEPQNLQDQNLRYCPICKGEIKEPIAKFCYHCGSKLDHDLMR